jgi:hypothetical protein
MFVKKKYTKGERKPFSKQLWQTRWRGGNVVQIPVPDPVQA